MKKCICVAVVAALFAVPAFGQTTLDMRVVTTGDAATYTASGSAESVPVYIQALLGGTATDGLALFGLNLTNTGDVPIDLCDQVGSFIVTAPAGLPNFDRNDGLTNPPGLGDPFITGYSGTCDGASGLWQIGGGQNTIGNTGPTAYPTGAVVASVGNGTWATLAEGAIQLDGTESGTSIVLMPNTGFANTLDTGGVSPFPVTEVATGDITLSGLTITFGVPCPPADVDCSGTPDAGDILIVRGGANWNQSPPATARADVDGSGTADAGDILVIRGGANWNVSFSPCVCP